MQHVIYGIVVWELEVADNQGFFFFSSRRRHTILQGDWSSDVCSCDLVEKATIPGEADLLLAPQTNAGRGITLPEEPPPPHGLTNSRFRHRSQRYRRRPSRCRAAVCRSPGHSTGLLSSRPSDRASR